MDFLQENTSIGSLVMKTPEYASLFEKLGLDYCCKGHKTLKELCDEKGLDVSEVLQKLNQISTAAPAVDWNQMSLKEVVEHIVDTYHVYLEQELPRISQLIRKLNMKHGEKYPYVAELQDVFEELEESLFEHINEEEEIVFPFIIQLAVNGKSDQEKVNKYISSLDEDHLKAGAALEKMRKLTNDYTPPSDACMTHIVMLNSLSHLERNLHEHIHKENHVLFPRAMKMHQQILSI